MTGVVGGPPRAISSTPPFVRRRGTRCRSRGVECGAGHSPGGCGTGRMPRTHFGAAQGEGAGRGEQKREGPGSRRRPRLRGNRGPGTGGRSRSKGRRARGTRFPSVPGQPLRGSGPVPGPLHGGRQGLPTCARPRTRRTPYARVEQDFHTLARGFPFFERASARAPATSGPASPKIEIMAWLPLERPQPCSKNVKGALHRYSSSIPGVSTPRYSQQPRNIFRQH